MTEPWERLDGESSRAYAAFATYRDMGPDRSQTKVAQESGKNRALIARWSAQHSWVLRAERFDAEEDRRYAKSRQARLRRASERNAEIAARAINRVGEAIDSFKPKQMTPSASARLLNSAVRMEQLSLGGHTARVSLTDGTESEAPDYSGMTQEDIFRRLVELRDHLIERVEEQRQDYETVTGIRIARVVIEP